VCDEAILLQARGAEIASQKPLAMTGCLQRETHPDAGRTCYIGLCDVCFPYIMHGGVVVAFAMKPIHAYLRQDQIEPLRAEAKRRGVSLAELVRQGVDHVLQEAPIEEDPLWKIIGIMDSGVSDLAENHDKYLAAIRRPTL